jgi:hypothetical protein
VTEVTLDEERDEATDLIDSGELEDTESIIDNLESERS